MSSNKEELVIESNQAQLNELDNADKSGDLEQKTDGSETNKLKKKGITTSRKLDLLLYLNLLGFGLCLVLSLISYLEFESVKTSYKNQVEQEASEKVQKFVLSINQKINQTWKKVEEVAIEQFLTANGDEFNINETKNKKIADSIYSGVAIEIIDIPFENTQIVDNPSQGYAFLSSLDNLLDEPYIKISNLEMIKPGSENENLTMIRLMKKETKEGEKKETKQFFMAVKYPNHFINDLVTNLNKTDGSIKITQGELNKFELYNEKKSILTPLTKSQKINKTPWTLEYAYSIPELTFSLGNFSLLIVYLALTSCAVLFTLVVFVRRLKKYLTSRRLRLMQETALGQNSLLINDDSLTNLGNQSSVALMDVTTEDENTPILTEDDYLSEAIFTVHGIRGVVNTQITAKTLYRIGQNIAQELESLGMDEVTIACDNRSSSLPLLNALNLGLKSNQIKTINIGETITPVMYQHAITHSQGNGLMVTGGSAAADINGLKVLINKELYTQSKLKSICLDQENGNNLDNFEELNTADNVSLISGDEASKYVLEYLNLLKKDLKVSSNAKVVVDSCHAVSGVFISKFLSSLGCNVITINEELHSTFQGRNPNPSKPENLQMLIETVKAEKAGLGFFINSDATSLGVISSKGEIIWPDRVLMLLAKDLLSRKKGAKILYDVKSTSTLHDWIINNIGEPDLTPSGYIQIKERMDMQSAQLAAEFTGHYFIKEEGLGFDDAIFAMLKILKIASLPTQQIHKLFDSIPDKISTPEILISVQPGQLDNIMSKLLVQKDEFNSMGVITIDGLRVEYEDGWGIVRASHTSNALSLRFEADNHEALQRIAEKFKEVVLSVVFVKFPF